MKTGKVLVAVAAVLAALVVSACGGGGSDSSSSSGSTDGSAGGSGNGPIVIGAAVGESGFLIPYDMPNFNAFKLAINEVNEEGGIDGRQVKVISADTRSEPSAGRAAAGRLIGQGAEMIVTSVDYDYASAAANAAVEDGLLAVTLGAGSVKFGPQAIGPTAFSPSTSAAADGSVGSEFALKKGWKDAFLLIDDTLNYDEESCRGFADNLEGGGGEVVGTVTYKQEDTSASSMVSDIKAASPDVIQICSYAPGMTGIVRQLRAAGIDQPIITNTGGDGDYWLAGVPNLSDFYVTSAISIYGDDPVPAVNKFVKDYAAEYGEEIATGLAVQGYAAGQLIVKAIEQAGGSTEGEKLAEVLNTWKGEELLPGPASFDDEIHVSLDRPQRMIEVRNGKPRFNEMVEVKRPPEYGL